MTECKHCKKICKNVNSLRNHERLCRENPNKQSIVSNFIKYNERIKAGAIKKQSSNQYTKAEILGIEKPKVSDQTKLKISKANKNIKWNQERKKAHSISMKKAIENHPDSYTKNNVVGRVKNIMYNGTKLKGTWELIVAKWLDANHIEWQYETSYFYYEWNGKRKYYPDFYLPKLNIYVEVKGYETERDRCKWKVVPNLVIIKKEQIDKIKQNKYEGPLSALAHNE